MMEKLQCRSLAEIVQVGTEAAALRSESLDARASS
jgi:hypothetical protein